MKTIYTIATEARQVYGHGDSGIELRIVREGAYASGDFPPCFGSREKAEAYLAVMERKAGKKVVELEFYNE